MTRYPRPDLPPSETASPSTTIVGGRPPERHASQVPVPTGIQRLLRHAARHASFLDRLVEARAEAADETGIALSPSERAILAAVPEAAIRGMVCNLDPGQPVGAGRKAALAAAALLGGVGFTAPACGDTEDASTWTTEQASPGIPEIQDPIENVPAPPPPTRGILHDVPPPRPDAVEMQEIAGVRPDLPREEPPPRAETAPPPAGIRPDLLPIPELAPPPENPPPRPEVPVMQPCGGAAPDLPPARPEHREMETEGGAAPDLPPFDGAAEP